MRIAYPVLWSRLGRDAGQEQTVSTVAALARAGVEVTLVVPRAPGDPALSAQALRDRFGVRGDFGLVQRPSRWAGEHVVRTTLWMRQASADPLLAEFDLLYSRAPVMTAWPFAVPIPFATDHYRPWPDEPGWRWLRPFIRRTAATRHCLGYVSHSAFAAESYARIGVPREKLLVAHNGVDLDRMTPPLAKTEARARLALPVERPIALYAGRINPSKGLDQILALADLRPDTLFLLVGSEGDGAVERAARRRANVRVVPWQEPDALPAWLAAADILLIPPSSEPLRRFGTCVLPMKTFSYLAAARPILAPRSPDTAELLRDGDNALLVPPDSPNEAAEALDRLAGDSPLAARLAAGAGETAESHSWDARAARIAAFLEARLADFRASA